MENGIVVDGVVDFDALETALENDSRNTAYTLQSLPAQRIKWWEWPTMIVVGALLGSAVFFASSSLWLGV